MASATQATIEKILKAIEDLYPVALRQAKQGYRQLSGAMSQFIKGGTTDHPGYGRRFNVGETRGRA